MGCSTDSSQSSIPEGWELEQSISKPYDNVTFTFPAKGSAFENRDDLITLTQAAISYNAALLDLEEYTTPISVRFLTTREEMGKHSGMPVRGTANAFTKEVHMLFPDSILTFDMEHFSICPIKHEMMHMISCTSWGYPDRSMTWANEGLATYAENHCSGYTVSEIYRFLESEDMLIPSDTMALDFYSTEEMVGYHQCAFIVQYLIEKEGLEKFKTFWQSTFSDFESIYGYSYPEFELRLSAWAKELHPEVPSIDWDELSQGCF